MKNNYYNPAQLYNTKWHNTQEVIPSDLINQFYQKRSSNSTINQFDNSFYRNVAAIQIGNNQPMGAISDKFNVSQNNTTSLGHSEPRAFANALKQIQVDDKDQNLRGLQGNLPNPVGTDQVAYDRFKYLYDNAHQYRDNFLANKSVRLLSERTPCRKYIKDNVEYNTPGCADFLTNILPTNNQVGYTAQKYDSQSVKDAFDQLNKSHKTYNLTNSSSNPYLSRQGGQGYQSHYGLSPTTTTMPSGLNPSPRDEIEKERVDDKKFALLDQAINEAENMRRISPSSTTTTSSSSKILRNNPYFSSPTTTTIPSGFNSPLFQGPLLNPPPVVQTFNSNSGGTTTLPTRSTTTTSSLLNTLSAEDLKTLDEIEEKYQQSNKKKEPERKRTVEEYGNPQIVQNAFGASFFNPSQVVQTFGSNSGGTNRSSILREEISDKDFEELIQVLEQAEEEGKKRNYLNPGNKDTFQGKKKKPGEYSIGGYVRGSYDPYLNTYNYPNYPNSSYEPYSLNPYQENQVPYSFYEGGGYDYPDMPYSNAYDTDGQQYSFKEGGLVREEALPRLADLIRRYGRNGDTEVAHINPIEAHILKSLRGSSTPIYSLGTWMESK